VSAVSASQTYRLPRAVQERLSVALEPFRNREPALALANFLARFWSAPSRIVQAFHVDRRALCQLEDLGLSEDRIRGALKTLEAIGFLDRVEQQGSRYKATEDGLRRKPIFFRFALDYRGLFEVANKAYRRAKERLSALRQAIMPQTKERASTGLCEARSQLPQIQSPSVSVLHLGEKEKESGIPPKAFEPDPKLESALERLKRAIGIAEGDRGAT
jgi:hypothetical protein